MTLPLTTHLESIEFELLAQQDLEDLDGSGSDRRTGAEDCGSTGFVQIVVILVRNDTADDNHNIFAAQFLELLDDLWYKGLVAGSQRRYTHYVNVIFDSLFSSLGRSLEQRTHIHIESDIGITGSNHFSATVVTILTQFGNHDTRLTTLFLSKFLGQSLGFGKFSVVFHFC